MGRAAAQECDGIKAWLPDSRDSNIGDGFKVKQLDAGLFRVSYEQVVSDKSLDTKEKSGAHPARKIIREQLNCVMENLCGSKFEKLGASDLDIVTTHSELSAVRTEAEIRCLDIR